MRIAIASDFHANFQALRAIADVLESADRVLCLGDYTGYYCEVNEVLDYVRGLNAVCVLGNHDQFLLNGAAPADAPEAVHFGIAWADRVIESGHRAWLAALPLSWGGTFDGRTVLAAHGSPWRPMDDYLYADNPRLAALREFDFDLVAFGQTHRPIADRSARPWLVNPGAVGQSRHVPGVASVAVWDTRQSTLEMIDRPYDASPVNRLARENGAGDWITKHLV